MKREREVIGGGEEVKRERGETIELLLPEQSPVGDSQGNGKTERAIRTVQGQVGTLKPIVETKHSTEIGKDSVILLWLIKYAVTLINLSGVGRDGMTPFEMRRGRK